MIKLTLCHLYPELLNLYGDTGNILTLVKRCEWRGINIDVVKHNVGDKGDFKDVDMFFIGGGADSEQGIAVHDMENIKPELKDAVEEGKILLAICGGYQLLGQEVIQLMIGTLLIPMITCYYFVLFTIK